MKAQFSRGKTVYYNRTLTIFIQVEVILITKLLRATGDEYVIVPKKVLEAGDLGKTTCFCQSLFY